MGSIAYGTLDVNASVAVHDGCEISCTVNPGYGMSVTVKGTNRRRGPGGADEFEFWFETEALRAFLDLGVRALTELDRAAGDHATDQSLPAPVGEDCGDAQARG
jgi:hypothetical protein